MCELFKLRFNRTRNESPPLAVIYSPFDCQIDDGDRVLWQGKVRSDDSSEGDGDQGDA